MQRLTSTGLATAYFRLYILDALATAPARPPQLLLRAGSERLPFANGAFSRALQSLLDSGHLRPAPHGAVALTALGAAERGAELDRWRAVLPAVVRLTGEPGAAPAPPTLAEIPVLPREARVADAYLDRVLVSTLRDRLAAAREGGRAFTLVLGTIDLEHASVAHRRAMVHRTIRATLGGCSTLFGSDIDPYRYGDTGVALVASCGPDGDRGSLLAALLRTRVEELLRTMTGAVRAFGGARWTVRAGSATWSPSIVTTAALLRRAQDALAQDAERPIAV